MIKKTEDEIYRKKPVSSQDMHGGLHRSIDLTSIHTI
jgi:hypothetical protein